MPVWERRSPAEVLQAGRDPTKLPDRPALGSTPGEL